MSTLIRFEDRYGCATLFDNVSKLNRDNCIIQPDLCDTGVFKVTRNEAINNEIIIIVFDLDDENNLSLTGESLRNRLNRFILKDNNIKDAYINKIIIIPVFICYETLYLYSEHVRKVITNIGTYEDTETVRLIKAFKKYYDYSMLNPEYIDGLKYRLQDIRNSIDIITEQPKTRGKFLPQHFHKSYSKQVLKILFKDIIKAYSSGDKLLDKNVGELFNQLKSSGNEQFINNIVDGLGDIAILNTDIYRLLTAQSVSELYDLILTTEKLDKICNKLDDYNKRLKRLIVSTHDLEALETYKKIGEK